jgi:hypothetical protein
MELHLQPVVYWRFAYMMGIPLGVALLVSAWWIKILCWAISFFIMTTLLKSWGETVFSIAIVLLMAYLFFEWKSTPRWLAIPFGIIAVLQFKYIANHIKKIEQFKEGMSSASKD